MSSHSPECSGTSPKRGGSVRRCIMLIVSRGVGALTVILVLVVATPQGRTAVETALFIPQIIPTIPVKPQEWVSRAPIRQEVEFPTQDGIGVADLYSQPGDEKRGSVLLFLGVNPAGRDDPRVVGLANGLARTGVVVMIPWSDTMTDQRVDVSEVDNLVRAFEFLIAQESVDPDRSGMGGFCVGASLATVAAQDERIRSKVKFVNFFGGYYDARDLVTSVVSHSRFHGDVVEPWQPDVLSKRVVTTHLIEGLSNAEEQALLTRVFVTKDAALGDEAIEALSPEAKVVNRLLGGVPLDEARILADQLPDSVIETLYAISPISKIEDLEAKVLIMHDRQDRLVPSEESRRLAKDLASRGGVSHTEFSLFQHLDPTRPVSPPVYVRELFKLYMHMYRVLREWD